MAKESGDGGGTGAQAFQRSLRQPLGVGERSFKSTLRSLWICGSSGRGQEAEAVHAVPMPGVYLVA